MWTISGKTTDLLVAAGSIILCILLASCGAETKDDQPAQGNSKPAPVDDQEQILSSGQLAAYNGLTDENKQQFNELLPQALEDVHPADRDLAVDRFASMAQRSQEHLRALKEEPLIELPPLRETLSSQEQKRLDTLDHRLREAFIWWWEGYLEAESYIEPGEVEFIVAQRRMVLGALPIGELDASDFLSPDSVAELNSFSQHAQDYFWRAIAGQMTQGSAFMPDPDSGRCCVTAKQNLDLDPDYLKAYVAWQLEHATYINDPMSGTPSPEFAYNSNP